MPNAFQPMGEMNTTPLIDVLLVLLIMFIISIPAATQSVEIELPRPCEGCPLPPLSTVSNTIAIDTQDRVLWNGQVVAPAQLAALLVQTRGMAVEPELRFEPAARAGYDASARTLATIKASGVTNFGFVGNERYRKF